MSLNQSKIVGVLEKVPYRFWVLMTLALGIGLVSLIGQKTFRYIQDNHSVSDYPFYDRAINDGTLSQDDFYKEVAGTWYVQKGTTELVLQLYGDGYFSLDSVDETMEYLRLFSMGRYVRTPEGALLLSQRVDIDFPFPEVPIGVTFHQLDVEEVVFDYTHGAQKKLSLSVLKSDVSSPAFIAFLNSLSDDQGVLEFRYLGTPSPRRNY